MAYNMRTTVTLDPELLVRATQVLPDASRSAMLSEALRALIERETVFRLARLGGGAQAGSRRCAEFADELDIRHA